MAEGFGWSDTGFTSDPGEGSGDGTNKNQGGTVSFTQTDVLPSEVAASYGIDTSRDGNEQISQLADLFRAERNPTNLLYPTSLQGSQLPQPLLWPETETNLLQDIFGIDERLIADPFTNEVREVYDLNISPLSMLAGAFFGLPGVAASTVAKIAGFQDPTGFAVTVDPRDIATRVTEVGVAEGRDNQNEQLSQKTDTLAEQPQPEADTTLADFRDRVAEIVAGAQLEAFPMPEFRLLEDEEFGSSLISLEDIFTRLRDEGRLA